MKKYGVRVMPNKDRSFSPRSDSGFNHCRDTDDGGYFGTDDLNDAYKFRVYLNRSDVEVFEKNNG